MHTRHIYTTCIKSHIHASQYLTAHVTPITTLHPLHHYHRHDPYHNHDPNDLQDQHASISFPLPFPLFSPLLFSHPTHQQNLTMSSQSLAGAAIAVTNTQKTCCIATHHSPLTTHSALRLGTCNISHVAHTHLTHISLTPHAHLTHTSHLVRRPPMSRPTETLSPLSATLRDPPPPPPSRHSSR